jgi:hypothetical protein
MCNNRQLCFRYEHQLKKQKRVHNPNINMTGVLKRF